MNNKGTDQTARMRRLICSFVVRIWHKQVFSWCGSILLGSFIWIGYYCEYNNISIKSFNYRFQYFSLTRSVWSKPKLCVMWKNYNVCETREFWRNTEYFPELLQSIAKLLNIYVLGGWGWGLLPINISIGMRCWNRCTFLLRDYMIRCLFQHQIIWVATLFHLPIISIQAADQFSQFFSMCYKDLHFKMMKSSVLTKHTIIIWIDGFGYKLYE